MIFESLAFLIATGAIISIIISTMVAVPDQSEFDQPQHALHREQASVSAENEKVLQLVAAMQDQLLGVSKPRRLVLLRRLMDEGFTDSPSDAESLGVDILPADAAGVVAEWTVAPGASASRRLLYVHGGGFAVGSPRSHRMITAALSKACGVAVLAIDYRLMPENRRSRSIHDCQAAYRWILENGPDGTGDASEIFVAGDSAGGNLTLMLSAWVRDAGLRQMDCAIAFSPNTDASLGNPLIKKNWATDPMLGPGLAPLVRMPDTIRRVAIAIAGLMSPRNPLMSPQFGDLSNLPPTLVQASDCEMLLGDAIRYVNKARSQGSPVTLQVWPGMVHVWQMFQHILPEAGLAIEEVAAFIRANSSAAQVVHSGEGSFRADDGTEIFYRCWAPPQPRAVILLAHGLAEHSGRYAEFAGFFVAAGIAVYALDHPGHGRSAGLRGHISHFSEFTGALLQLLEIARNERPDTPVVLFGHSMGGLIAAETLLQHQSEFVAAVLTGAAIQSPQQPSRVALFVSKLLAAIAPRFGVLRLDASGISRDPQVVSDYENDPLVYRGKTTAGFVTAMIAAMNRVIADAATIELPILIMHGGIDSLTAVDGSRLLHDTVSSKDKELVVYEGLYHEILNEPERQRVMDDILEWLKPRLVRGPNGL